NTLSGHRTFSFHSGHGETPFMALSSAGIGRNLPDTPFKAKPPDWEPVCRRAVGTGERPEEREMPELPEVETVRRGLAPVMEGARIERVELRRGDLRFPFPADFPARLSGRRISALGRRAKY